MIKAGEAGGALEIILRRLADFMEKAEALKRKVKGALVYPVVVVMVAVGILTFIMIKIVPTFTQLFDDFELELPGPTRLVDHDFQTDGELLVPDSSHSLIDFPGDQVAAEVQTGADGLGPGHVECPRVRHAD